MSLDQAIDTAARSEQALADQLDTLADRHADEPDVYHVARTQAGKAAARRGLLASLGTRGRGNPLAGSPAHEPAQDRQQPDGRSGSAPTALLEELQEAYVAAQRAEIAWVVLLQGARAVRDSELVGSVSSAHQDCEAAARWLRTRIKVTAPQVLATG